MAPHSHKNASIEASQSDSGLDEADDEGISPEKGLGSEKYE
jgi:hypothetical protein